MNPARALRFLMMSLRDRRAFSEARKAVSAYHTLPPAECPSCGFHGRFVTYGRLARTAVQCPACGSVDRHRLIVLAAQRGVFDVRAKRVLHFAPEPAMVALLEAQAPSQYLKADIDPAFADIVLDIEHIDLPDESVDVVFCSHVLEHVDDRKAIAEIYRILAPGGVLLAMVPLIEGWATSYENPAITTYEDRDIHFGQSDHVRFHGADFRDRLEAPGFKLREFTAEGADSARYRLNRGEKLFLAEK